MPAPDERTWTPEDVSYFLGVPVPTLYRWHYLGTGPKARPSRPPHLHLPADIMAWLREQQEVA